MARRRPPIEPTVTSTAQSAFSGDSIEVPNRVDRTMASIRSMLGMWARIEDGEWHRPDHQGRLDVAMVGQVFYCPNCGHDHPAPTQGHITCRKCTAIWVVSLGFNPNTQDIAVVRIERWK